MKGKIIVFDVGNTLICTSKGICLSNSVLECLQALRNKGYILGIATLRTIDMIHPIIEQFTFDFLILMNGGLIIIDEQIMYSKPLESNIVDKIILESQKKNIKVKPFSYDEKCYALELESAKDCFSVCNNYTYYIWDDSGNIDITSLGVTKVNALKYVLNYYSLTKEECISFGDGFNDYEMLAYVGFGVAMDGAPDAVTNVANYVTKSAENDGVLYACKELKLI